jgi:hypothetical protein
MPVGRFIQACLFPLPFHSPVSHVGQALRYVASHDCDTPLADAMFILRARRCQPVIGRLDHGDLPHQGSRPGLCNTGPQCGTRDSGSPAFIEQSQLPITLIARLLRLLAGEARTPGGGFRARALQFPYGHYLSKHFDIYARAHISLLLVRAGKER